MTVWNIPRSVQNIIVCIVSEYLDLPVLHKAASYCMSILRTIFKPKNITFAASSDNSVVWYMQWHSSGRISTPVRRCRSQCKKYRSLNKLHLKHYIDQPYSSFTETANRGWRLIVTYSCCCSLSRLLFCFALLIHVLRKARKCLLISLSATTHLTQY